MKKTPLLGEWADTSEIDNFFDKEAHKNSGSALSERQRRASPPEMVFIATMKMEGVMDHFSARYDTSGYIGQ